MKIEQNKQVKSPDSAHTSGEPLKRTELSCSIESNSVFSPDAHTQIAGKQDSIPVHVLTDTTVPDLAATKQLVFDQKRMLYLTTCGRFAIFDLFFPVDTCVRFRSQVQN